MPVTQENRQTPARAKARLGMQIAGNPLGLASEGTFATGFGPVVENTELLLFLDDELGLELVEGFVGVSALPQSRRIQNSRDALAFACSVGFPRQGVILQTAPDGPPPSVHKNITHLDQLRDTAERLLSEHGTIVISPDYRADQAPSRARTIRGLCVQMAERLATQCPHCHAPGFGRIDVERGVPCAPCGTPTQLIAADLIGCVACPRRERQPRDIRRADPKWCDDCNP